MSSLNAYNAMLLNRNLLAFTLTDGTPILRAPTPSTSMSSSMFPAPSGSTSTLIPPQPQALGPRQPPGRYVSLSCQSVGIGSGGTIPMLARATVVDYRGTILLDCLVQPTQPVVSYRTTTTGFKAEHFLEDRMVPFHTVQASVAELIRGKVVVGYSLWTDFSVLGISHPALDTRDLAVYLPFRTALHTPNQIIGLQTLIWQLMRRHIRSGYINPVEDSRAAIDLFRSHEEEWEGQVSAGYWPCALPPANFARCFM